MTKACIIAVLISLLFTIQARAAHGCVEQGAPTTDAQALELGANMGSATLHDEAGHLRYVVGSLGAMSGASLKVTVFLAEDGAVLWTDRVRSGPAHAFPEARPEDALVRDPSKDFVAPGPKGCRGR